MGYNEPLLFTDPDTSHSPRNLRIGHHRVASASVTTPTSTPRNPPPTPTDVGMVVAVHDDEASALVAAKDAALVGAEDAPVVRSVRGVWAVFAEESRRLWAIGAPIVFNIFCLYGMSSTTQIFAGHIGNHELSAVSIGLSVISHFSFGFLVSLS